MSSVSAFDLWRTLISYLKLTPDMPVMLKSHFFYLEVTSLLEHCWALEDSSLIGLIKSQASNSLKEYKREATRDSEFEKENFRPQEAESANSISKSEEVGPADQLFFKSLLNLAADRVHTLCNLLEFSEKQMEFVWILVKYIICEHIGLLLHRHLDLMIICSIYGAIKRVDRTNPKSFNTILNE